MCPCSLRCVALVVAVSVLFGCDSSSSNGGSSSTDNDVESTSGTAGSAGNTFVGASGEGNGGEGGTGGVSVDYIYDGMWSGTNDEGDALSFAVCQNQVQQFSMPVTFSYSGSHCSDTGEQSQAVPILDGAASLYLYVENAGNGLDIVLTFADATTASGDAPAVRNGGLICSNPATLIFGTEATVAGPYTMTATKVGANGCVEDGGVGGASGTGGSSGVGGATAVAVSDLGESCSVLSDYCEADYSWCTLTVDSCESGMCAGTPTQSYCSVSCTTDADCAGGLVTMRCMTGCGVEFVNNLCWDEDAYAVVLSSC